MGGFAAQALSCALYCTMGPAIIFVNRHILTSLDFHFPLTVSFMGSAFSTAFAYFCVHVLKIVPLGPPLPSAVYFKKIVPIGLLISLSIALGNAAYLFISVAFIQMIKGFAPVMLMLQCFALALEVPSRKLVLAILTICVGTIISSYGEIRFSLTGFLLMMVSNLAETTRLTMQQTMSTDSKFKFGAVEGLYHYGPATCAWLAVGIAAKEAPALRAAGAGSVITAHAALFALASALGCAVLLSNLLVIQHCSALTLKVLLSTSATLVLPVRLGLTFVDYFSVLLLLRVVL